MSASSSSWTSRPDRRPQQYGVSPDQYRGILRQTPPTGGNSRHFNYPASATSSRLRPALVLDAAASSGGASHCSASSVSLISQDSYDSFSAPNNISSHSHSMGSRIQGNSSRGSRRDLPQSLPQHEANNAPFFTPRCNDSQFLGLQQPTPTSTNTPFATAAATAITNNNDILVETAATIARQAPCAGYLEKLGTNVPGFKRRFFILQPTTSLYYFLSPNDTTPRGCLDLEGSTLEDMGELANGKCRFAVVWEDRKVVLEARSKELAQEWMERLERERMSYVKADLAKQQRQNSAAKSRITELERQVADFKLVEKDRDGALEDAVRWRDQFEQLDESLRRLTQQLVRQPEEESELVNESNASKDDDEAKEQDGESSATTTPKESANDVDNGDTSRETSLLDEGVKEENAIDVMSVPGVHYSALFNTCEQLRENLRLASFEASTAVEDLTTANERVVSVEKRMEKAEKHLCKIWEENCSVRKALKQKKREKRVLVREVKNLQEAVKTQKVDDLSAHDGPSVAPDDSSTVADDSGEEDKLINELEEHVISSIRLHEQLLVANGHGLTTPRAKAKVTEVMTDTTAPSSVDRVGPTVKIGKVSWNHSDTIVHSNESHNDLETPIASLFDDSDSESDDEEDDDDVVSVSPSFVSSVVAEASDCEGNGFADEGIVLHSRPRPDGSPESTPERPNPLFDLDTDDDDDNGVDQPNLCAASSQSESSKSALAFAPVRDQATSRLACPLADVVSTNQNSNTFDVPRGGNEELQVYHLTFYSRKIGLQFQKVPPPPVKARGLLTDAMTADLAEEPSGSDKTAAELRRIAAISTWAKSESDEKHATCQVAIPVDAVLVCGFHGFDDTGDNVRPNLGARLVAFDGVSVEVGKWTFDSIRKSIQARARPLTLSFRNDFLTTEQRTILTKAVQDVDDAVPPPRRAIQYRLDNDRPPSVEPSIQSHESEHFINDYEDGERVPRNQHSEQQQQQQQQHDDLSASATSSDNYYRGYAQHALPQSFSGTKSISSFTNRSASNFRSFSEAGSTASVLSAVGPLVANLLKGRGGSSSEPFTPEYLRREPASVEDTPQHLDFKSELL